jgi:sodium pump decarboxylase gamma subunit
MGETLVAALMILVVGLSATFLCLLFLSAMIWSFKSIDERLNMWRIQRYAQKVEGDPHSDGVRDEIVAVIAAAITAAVRRPIVIRRVRFLESDRTGSWAVTGRINVMASHAITRRKS